MAAFTFGDVSLGSSKKGSGLETKGALLYERAHSNDETHLIIVLETFPNQRHLDAFTKWLDRQIPQGYNYRIVSLSKYSKTSEEIKKEGVAEYYKRNAANILSYMTDKTIMITSGRAIYGITGDSNIHINSFYDIVFTQTYFYSREYECNVFPIDALEDIFKITPMGILPRDSFRMHFAEIQIKKILKNYDGLSEPPCPTRLKITKLMEADEADNFLKAWTPVSCKVCWDLETSGFDFVNDRIGCITMSFDGREGFYIPWYLIDKNLLTEFFRNKIQIGQNLKFDVKFLLNAGISTAKIDIDTLPMAQTLNESRSNSLKSLAFYYTQFGGYDRDLDDYKKRYNPKTYLDIPEKILSQYATMDAIINFQVYEAMEKRINWIDLAWPPPVEGWWTVREYFEKKRMPAMKMFVPVEIQGIEVDMDIWDKNSLDVDKEMKDLQRELSEKLKVQEFLGGHGLKVMSLDFHSFFDDCADEDDPESNFNSGKQLGEILKWLGWENCGMSKSGYYLTGDEQLTQWEQLGRPEATILKKLRAYKTLQKTFLGLPDTNMGWRQHLKFHEDLGKSKLHPVYNVMGAETGRNTCREPNWTNLPSHSLGSDLVKEIVSVPDIEHCKLVTMDYSGLQLRLAALDGNDAFLLKAYKTDPNADVHSTTGWNVFCRNKEFEINEVIINQDGKEYVFFADETVKVKRGEKTEEVKARNLKETDTLVIKR